MSTCIYNIGILKKCLILYIILLLSQISNHHFADGVLTRKSRSKTVDNKNANIHDPGTLSTVASIGDSIHPLEFGLTDMNWDVKLGDGSQHAKVEETVSDIFAYSCSEKCGFPGWLPCSCAETCLIYDNCCEDIETACPRLTKAARLRFIHLLTNMPHSQCLSSGYDAVTSCNGLVHPTAEQDNMFNLLEATPASERLKVILDHVPYTDELTGLTFLNKDIFECNNPDSQGRGIPWRANVKASGTPKNGNNVGVFSENIFFECFGFVPPKSLENTQKLSDCTVLYIEHCALFHTSNTSVIKLCSEGDVAFVHYRTEDLVFKNKHCALCNNIDSAQLVSYKHKSYYPSHCLIYDVVPLSMTFSLSNDNIHIELVNFTGNLDWRPSSCNIPVSRADTGHGLSSSKTITCDVIDCPEHLVSWQGSCHPTVIVTLGVGQGQCKRNDGDLDLMSELWQCYLGDMLRLDVLRGMGSEVRYSNTLKKMVILSKFKVRSKFANTVTDFLASELHMMQLTYFAAAVSLVRKGKVDTCGPDTVSPLWKEGDHLTVDMCLQASLATSSVHPRVDTASSAVDSGCLQTSVYDEEIEFVDLYVNGTCLGILEAQRSGVSSGHSMSQAGVILTMLVAGLS